MAATGYTPIYLYYSGTATHIPLAANLGNGELAINAADGNLFYKNTANAVVTVPLLQSSSSNNGWLSSTDWSTFNGKQAALSSGINIKTVSGTSLLGSGDVGTIGTGYGGTGLTSFTANGVVYASSTSALATSSLLTFDGSTYLGLTGAMKINSDGYKLRFYDSTGTTSYGYIWSNGNSWQIDTQSNQPIEFLINGSETMRLTGSGLGVAISNPTAKIDAAGTIRGSFLTREGTYTNGSTTPSVDGISYMAINNTSPTTITNFTNGTTGQILVLKFNDSNTTINRANTYLLNSTNYSSVANGMLTLIFIGVYWYELCRSNDG